MKEKIYKYIVERKRGVPSKEIIEKFFHVLDHYPQQMESIIESMLKDDPRFVRDEVGQWFVQKRYEKQDLTDVVFTIVEFEIVPINQKSKIPVLLGIIQIQNLKLIYNQLFSLEIPADISKQLKQHIDHKVSEISLELSFAKYFDEIYHKLERTVVVAYAPSKIMTTLNYFFRSRIGLELELETISLVSLARKMIPGIKIRSIEDIAKKLSISFPYPLDLTSRINLIYEIFSHFIDVLIQTDVKNLEDLKLFIESTTTWIDFTNYSFNKDYIKNLPMTPGIYLLKNKQGQIFYVGKAKNLKSRVESYFINRSEMDEKTKSILSKISDLTYEEVGSELEALLLENEYINKYRPELNTQIKIHPLDISKYKTKKMILFLQGTTENEIVLFLVNGTNAIEKIKINLKENLDWDKLKDEINQIFFEFGELDGEYSFEQIEIIWRWFSLNHQYINFIDIEKCGSLEDCLEMVKKYCADENLLSEKIFYL